MRIIFILAGKKGSLTLFNQQDAHTVLPYTMPLPSSVIEIAIEDSGIDYSQGVGTTSVSLSSFCFTSAEAS